MTSQNAPRKAAILLLLGLSPSILLSGCGGSSASKTSFAPFTASGPVVSGLQPSAANANLSAQPLYIETSGAGLDDGKTAFLTAAVASDALPLSSLIDSNTKTIPLGFGPGGLFVDNTTFGTALHPGASFLFRASIANGSNSSGTLLPIQSVQLSSSDLGVAAQAMTFDFRNAGPLANGQYKSGTLTVPAGATTGLKTLSVQVSDGTADAARHNPSMTTFAVVVLAGSDAAVVAQITDAKGNPVAGATASITGADAPGYVGPGESAAADPTFSVSDNQGMVVLFAAPGAADADGNTNTITVSSGTKTGTAPVKLTPGQALTNTGGTAFAISIT